jgi:hypothetical protein
VLSQWWRLVLPIAMTRRGGRRQWMEGDRGATVVARHHWKRGWKDCADGRMWGRMSVVVTDGRPRLGGCRGHEHGTHSDDGGAAMMEVFLGLRDPEGAKGEDVGGKTWCTCGLEMAMGKYPPGITTPYPYLRAPRGGVNR